MAVVSRGASGSCAWRRSLALAPRRVHPHVTEWSETFKRMALTRDVLACGRFAILPLAFACGTLRSGRITVAMSDSVGRAARAG
eukprot:6210436-Pleurochrysis_carterae.AAC.1